MTSITAPESQASAHPPCGWPGRLQHRGWPGALAGVLPAPQVQPPPPLTPQCQAPPREHRWRGAGGLSVTGGGTPAGSPCPPCPQLCLQGWGWGSSGATACDHHPREGVGLSGDLSSAHADGFPPSPLGCASSAHEWLWKVPEACYRKPLRYTPHAGYRDSPSQHGPERGFGKCFEDELSSGVRRC